VMGLEPTEPDRTGVARVGAKCPRGYKPAATKTAESHRVARGDPSGASDGGGDPEVSVGAGWPREAPSGAPWSTPHRCPFACRIATEALFAACHSVRLQACDTRPRSSSYRDVAMLQQPKLALRVEPAPKTSTGQALFSKNPEITHHSSIIEDGERNPSKLKRAERSLWSG